MHAASESFDNYLLLAAACAGLRFVFVDLLSSGLWSCFACFKGGRGALEEGKREFACMGLRLILFWRGWCLGYGL